MHHSLTRHRNFSVLSNYLGITANESRSPFASAECRRRRRVYRPRVFRLYTRTYKDIPRPQRTHTNAIRVDSRSRRRRRHLAVVTNCSTVLFPSRPGIRRIAFQQLLNTPAEGKRGQSGTASPFLVQPSFPTLRRASSFWRSWLTFRARRRFSLNRPLQPRGRAYLNEPTIEITNRDFCQQVFSRRHTRPRFLRRQAWTILLLIYVTPGSGGREKIGGARWFLVRARTPRFAFFPLLSFLLFACYHRRVRGRGRNRLKQLDFQPFGSRPPNGSEPAGLGLLSR